MSIVDKEAREAVACDNAAEEEADAAIARDGAVLDKKIVCHEIRGGQ